MCSNTSECPEDSAGPDAGGEGADGGEAELFVKLTAVWFSDVTVSVNSRNFMLWSASAEVSMSMRPRQCPW